MLNVIAFALANDIAFSYEDGTMVATTAGVEVAVWEHPDTEGVEKVLVTRGDVTEVFGPGYAFTALAEVARRTVTEVSA